jgi:hypothetical protein
MLSWVRVQPTWNASFPCSATDSTSPRRHLATPEEDRWRLLQAATDLLHSAAARQPLLVVLEDLHEADCGTLDLLLYLAGNLLGARILIIGTYRDVEVDRAHPLSAALTELHRASKCSRRQAIYLCYAGRRRGTLAREWDLA